MYSLLLDRPAQNRYHIKHSPRRSPTLRGLHTGVHQALAFIFGFGLPDFLWADTFNAIFTDKAVTRVQHGMPPPFIGAWLATAGRLFCVYDTTQTQ